MKKSKKFFISALFSIAILSIAGCGGIGQNPKDVLSKYLDSSLHGNYEEAYQYVSVKDKGIKSLQEYLSEQATDESPFTKALASKISYEIKEVAVTGDQAKSNVVITTPDFSSIFTDVLGAAFMSAFGVEKNEKEIERMLAEKYKDKEIPVITRIQTFDLLKEPEGWKVFLNWEIKEKIDGTMKEAKQLEKEKKLYAAKEKYQEVLKLDSKSVEASQKIKEMDKEIESFNEKQAYIDNVKLYEFTARYFESMFEGRKPGVTFKIKNMGDKTLTKVKVTVYFKDASDNIIAEEDYHPVLVSDFSFGDNKPLKPNYIWQMESGKFYQAKSVPSEWQEGNAVAKITDIEFEK